MECCVVIEYSMTVNFCFHVRITFKCLRFFSKVIERKLTKIKTILPPPKTPVLGGYDGVPRDFSGNVVGGYKYEVNRIKTHQIRAIFFIKGLDFLY